MLKAIFTATALVVSSTAFNPARAEVVRYPTTGNPALTIVVPNGWTHKPLVSGSQPQTFLLTSPHQVEVAAIVLPNLATPEAFAQQISAFSHLQMRNQGPTPFLGAPGYMFDASFTNVAGEVINMHVIQAKIDKTHMALVEMRSPGKGTTARELNEGKQILATLKLASPTQ
jgi:hypothetical protein